MAKIARVIDSPKSAAVVAYQPWLKGERFQFCAAKIR
jgi:hypothetical protein